MKAVDKRANELNAEYIKKARNTDQKYCGTVRGTTGPVETKRLADNFPPDKCPCGQVPFWTTSPRTSSPLDNFPPDKFPCQASI